MVQETIAVKRGERHHRFMPRNDAERLQGSRVIILQGEFRGMQGVCLHEAQRGLFAIRPDDSDAVVSLAFERDFGLLDQPDGADA